MAKHPETRVKTFSPGDTFTAAEANAMQDRNIALAQDLNNNVPMVPAGSGHGAWTVSSFIASATAGAQEWYIPVQVDVGQRLVSATVWLNKADAASLEAQLWVFEGDAGIFAPKASKSASSAASGFVQITITMDTATEIEAGDFVYVQLTSAASGDDAYSVEFTFEKA